MPLVETAVAVALTPYIFILGGGKTAKNVHAWHDSKMSWAGVLIAVIFALLHVANFAARPFAQAQGQQIHAVALGVLAWVGFL